MKITFISWATSCSRSDNIARELGGTSHKIYWGRLGSNAVTIWLKYLGQIFSTWKILFKEKPEAVFVMTPPVFAGLAVYLYTLVARVPFVIDVHTAAILMPRWRHFQGLQRFLCRKAATTTVASTYLAQLIEKGGGHTTIVRDVPVVYDTNDAFSRNGRFTVATVCSFNYDEPIDQIFEAARQLPEVQFYVTGAIRDLDPKLAQAAPKNVQLTDFLPDADYGSLLQHADAVLTLTTRDHTMLRGAYEAIYLGTPVIISNWPILQESFDKGAVHVDNSAADIVRAVRQMQQHRERYRQAAKELREKKFREWEETKKAILERIRR